MDMLVRMDMYSAIIIGIDYGYQDLYVRRTSIATPLYCVRETLCFYCAC